MIVTIVCSPDEFIRLSEVFKQQRIFKKNKIEVSVAEESFSTDRVVRERKNMRYKILLDNLQKHKKITSMKLFRSARKNRYPLSYRSFQRDMRALSDMGYASATLQRSGDQGATCLYTFKRNIGDHLKYAKFASEETQ